MGHVRLGRLPKTIRWQGVVALIDEAPNDIPAVAVVQQRRPSNAFADFRETRL